MARELFELSMLGGAVEKRWRRARPDVECVVHLHAPWGVALSMLPGGLQPTSQWAMRRRRLGRCVWRVRKGLRSAWRR